MWHKHTTLKDIFKNKSRLRFFCFYSFSLEVSFGNSHGFSIKSNIFLICS